MAKAYVNNEAVNIKEARVRWERVKQDTWATWMVLMKVKSRGSRHLATVLLTPPPSEAFSHTSFTSPPLHTVHWTIEHVTAIHTRKG